MLLLRHSHPLHCLRRILAPLRRLACVIPSNFIRETGRQACCSSGWPCAAFYLAELCTATWVSAACEIAPGLQAWIWLCVSSSVCAIPALRASLSSLFPMNWSHLLPRDSCT